MAKKKAKAGSKKTKKKASKKTAKKASKKSSKKTSKKASKKTSKTKASKKKAAKKSSAKKSSAKKDSKSAPKEKASKKAPKKTAPKKVSKKKAAAVEEEEEEKPVRKLKLKAKEKRFYRDLLLSLRAQVTNGISFLAGDNLNRSARDSSGDLSSYSFHMADQGTDNFDREFALNLVSSENDILFEIDEAIQRLDDSTYGVCQKSGELIEKERLKVIPYARYCVKVQSEMERGKTRYRPFGPTLSQSGG